MNAKQYAINAAEAEPEAEAEAEVQVEVEAVAQEIPYVFPCPSTPEDLQGIFQEYGHIPEHRCNKNRNSRVPLVRIVHSQVGMYKDLRTYFRVLNFHLTPECEGEKKRKKILAW